MNTRNSFVRRFVSTAACVLLASQVAFTKDNRRDRCESVEFVIASEVNFANFTATGTAWGDLKGTVQFVGDPTSVAPVTGQVLPPTRDALSFTGELTVFTKHGSLTTRNVGVFQPGPFGTGAEFGTVVAGTGKYAEAVGVISFAVSGDESGSKFLEQASGRVCVPRPGDDD